MKQLNATRNWTVLIALALMVSAFRLVVAVECEISDWGCASASVTINNATWSQGDCPPGEVSRPNAEDLPVIRSPCEMVKGMAMANAALVSFNEECGEVVVGKEGILNINTGETGCEYYITQTNCGQWTFFIFNPKHSGVVTITATATGHCVECVDEDPCSCYTVDQTWEAIGYVQVDLPDDDGPPPPPPPPGPGPGPCGPCGTLGRELGTGSVRNDSVNFRLNLGRATPTRDAGYISLFAETPSLDLAKPDLLTVPFERPGVEMKHLGGIIKQVKSPQGLVNVAVKDNYEYHLQCFYETALAKDGNGDYILDGNGYYTTNAAAYSVWVVKNPDGATTNNRVWITQQNGTDRVFKYTYTSQDYRWDLLLPDGQTTNSTWKVADLYDSTITNYFREVRDGSALIRKNQKTYKYVAALADKVLTQEIDGDGAVTRTTVYTYYSGGASGGNANKLQRVDYPEGNWVYYKYDDSGRCITNYAALGNNAPPTSPNEPDPLTCKVTEYAYTLVYANDGVDDEGIISAHSPRRTIVKIPVSGTLREVSRSYHHFIDDYSEETRLCATPGAVWDDAGYVGTTTTKDIYGRPVFVASTGGTSTYYSYTDDTTVAQYLSADGDGTETTTVVDELGLPLSSTTKTVLGWSSGETLAAETYNYKDGSNNYLDPLRRSHDVTDDLAGLTTQYRYNCCALDYVIDPDGVKTYHVLDNLLKWNLGTSKVVEVVQSTERTIQITNKLDAAGAVLVTKRVGTNGSAITLAQSQYDVLGRLARQTNALGGVTVYTNTIESNRLCTTNTYADGGTRIEIYFRDGSLDRVIGTAIQPVRYEYGVETEGGVYRAYTKEIKLDAGFADTSEWTKSYTDALGRGYKTIYASASGTPTSQSFYNDLDQLWKTVDPDSVTNLFGYNGKGEREFSAIDLDNNEQIDTNDVDRVTRTISDVVTNSAMGANVRRTQTYVWGTNNNNTATLVSTVETAVNGLTTWNIVWNNSVGVTNKTQTVYAGSGNRYVTNTAPDGSYTISAFSYGRLISITRKDSANNQIAKTSYTYDAHGRQDAITDVRNGTTTFTFNNADQVVTATMPPPGSGQSSQTTTSYYDNLGRSTGQLLADNTSVTNELYPTGLLRRTYGSRAYPVGYSYDSQGQMKTMTNWSGFAGNTGARVTTWIYDGYRGFLTNKVYDGNSAGPRYTYTAAGRLLTRAWARGTNTTYAYNKAGDLSGVDYSDSTTDVTYGYDRRGRQTIITNGAAICTLIYNDASQLLVETNSGGTLNGLAVTNAYDSLLRRSAVALRSQSSTLNQFGYDNASRLSSVTNGLNVATYTYLANSPLVSQILFKTNNTTRMTITKQYDLVNRLQSIASAPSAAGVSPVGFGYTYNSANQRTRNTAADGSYWVYEYDSLGQVKRGAKFFNDGYPVPGQQFEYGFDDIGNRTSTKAGGDQNGAGMRLASYTANNLNQYSQRDVPGAVDVMGLALGTNGTLTVNSQTPWRKVEYFRKELTVANSSAALWTNISVAATGETTVSGNVFVPKTPELFYYDLDGNLTNDGRWTYTWDAENRLVNMTSASSAPTGSKLMMDFAYDWKGRRVEKLVSTNNGSIYVAQYTNRFVYDGWNLIAVLAPNSSLIRSFIWGLDLSGSLQGAGGVGGLLALNDAANGVHFCAYDGNGNVAALVKATDGTVSANCEYGPFGEVLRLTGPMAKANPFRFSTKYQDDETDLVYYGYRFYNQSTGRWLNRDPVEEQGGANLYEFVYDNPANLMDNLGNAPMGWPVIPPPGYPPSLPPTNLPPPPSQGFETGSQGRTDAVKNSDAIRADVAILVHNMLSSRDKTCTKGKAIERKRFKPASDTSVVSMYLTGYFLLGQVAVSLDGRGYYEVHCCAKKFGKWEIAVNGAFRDKFDQLIPPVFWPPNGFGSLPLTFVGEWVEFYSGSE